jgi:SAM-dependent methyltransferase
MNPAELMYDHFSTVASAYREIRTTDIEPISVISGTLRGLPGVRLADVGCGTGRYDLLLSQHIDDLQLTCIDVNESMLAQASEYLHQHEVTNFKTVQSTAETLPLETGSVDGITTFNAIHHFDFVRFVEEALDALDKKTGKIFIYTRTPVQNAASIWGQYFPGFNKKEDRLYDLNEMEQMIQSVDGIRLDTAISFKYEREAPLSQLVEKAHAKHYSTFSLYDDAELDEAVEVFQRIVEFEFSDTNRVEWSDQNTLLILSPS